VEEYVAETLVERGIPKTEKKRKLFGISITFASENTDRTTREGTQSSLFSLYRPNFQEFIWK
jgi:hypothetical protein